VGPVRQIHLETSRLRLRPIALEDLSGFHALSTEPSVRHFLFDDRSVSLDEARGFIEASDENFAQRGWGLWLVDATDSDESIAPAGFAGFTRSDEDLPDLVYAMHPAHQGAGHATEASRAVLDHIFRFPGVKRVLANVDEPNVASVRVLEKLGMRLVRRGTDAENARLYYQLECPPS